MSDERPDIPAKWSVLMLTAIDLLELDNQEMEALWQKSSELRISDVLDLAEPDWDKLAAEAIYKNDTFDILLSLTLDYFVELQLGGQLLDATVRALATMVELNDNSLFDRVINKASAQPIVTHFEVASIRNFRLDSFDIPQEILYTLQGEGLITWSDLTSTNERIILESSDSWIEALCHIRYIWLMKTYIQLASSRHTRLSFESFESFESMVEAFVGQVSKTERDKLIAFGRIGLLEDRKWTLDDLGDMFGITRERVRQIERKIIKVLSSPGMVKQLAGFWFAVEETLRVSGGACFTCELANHIAIKLDWDFGPNSDALISLLQLYKKFSIDRENLLVYDLNHKCLGCEWVIHDLEEVVGLDNPERSVREVLRHLPPNCSQPNRCGEYARLLVFSEGFLCYISKKARGVSIENGRVFCRDIRGSKVQLAERILDEAGRQMHFNEVYTNVIRLLPNDLNITEHNVHSWMNRSENLLLWDRGTFIHRKYVTIPNELITRVESWLLDKLNNGLPFVSVSGAYLEFKADIIESGIPSETALYSCLRESGNDSLAFHRYPYIVPNRSDYEMIPDTIALEQYILDAGGLVSAQEIRQYAIDNLCISEKLLPTKLPNVPNILRTGRGSCIHLENLKVDNDSLSPVIAHAKALASVDGHVSVKRVYADKKVSCFDMGIESPEMLYAVLHLHANEIIKTPKYPKIIACGYQKRDSSPKDVKNEVVNYIFRNNRPCSYQELEDYFVTNLGYNTNTVYSARYHNSIVRYSHGSLIHLEAVEWSKRKNSRLEYQAHKALTESRKTGRCYARISDLLEFHKLPELPDDISWTHTLLSELVARIGGLEILGNARNSYVAIPNEEEIKKLEDLICELLKTEHEGACELKSFEHYLIDAGIVKRHLTPRMLGDQKKVCISGHIIMLQELCSGT